MPYILNKTDGTIVATVQDASLDLTTDLYFVGRNYAGYGEWQNENFLKLLENFANTIYPPRPIEGQLWYDTANKKINVFESQNWKSLANLEVSTTNPISTEKAFSTGDLWFDSREQQLYAFNGENFVLIGPPSGADTRAQWKGDFEYSVEDTGTQKFNIKAIVGSNDEVVAIVSAETYTLAPPVDASPAYPIYDGTTSTIAKGITLKGANYLTGESASAGIYFWGSARHAVEANTATTAIGFKISPQPTVGLFPIPYTTSTNSTEVDEVYTTSTFYYNPFDNSVKADIFKGVATSAYYADLAERYESDAPYGEGTVVVIGGVKEITVTEVHGDIAVAGIISKNPAYMMNSDAGPDDTHPYVALRGRVPCLVLGPIRKGELLVTSSRPGYAEPYRTTDHPSAVIGKALENFEGSEGIIEVMV